jgi:hypothetical protein
MDQSWNLKGLYSRAANTSGIHLYLVPAANNPNGSVVWRNAADNATVANVINNSTAQFTALYPFAAGGVLGSSSLPYASKTGGVGLLSAERESPQGW